MRLSRRHLLKLSATALLAQNLWPGSLFAADVKAEDFQFICVNDFHFFDDKCRPWFNKVVAQMKSTPGTTDLLLNVGDLADGGTAAQFAAVEDVLKPLSLPTYVTIGNHDYPKDDDRKAYEQFHPNTLNYHFNHRGWQFLGIDSTNGTKANSTIVAESLQYMDDTLPKLDKNSPLIFFTHFPLGDKVTNRAKNADAVLNRLKEYNLRAVFNGHFHSLTQRKFANSIVTTDRCCSFKRGNHDGSKEKGYFVCQAKDGVITREFVEVKPV
jgi:3',5'-cyclic AMP phosphodiesterase CpdA